MGAYGTLAESNDWQKPASQSKFHWFIIKIGAEPVFWKAALRITPYFFPDHFGDSTGLDLMALSISAGVYARPATGSGEAAGPNFQHGNLVTSFIEPLVAFVSENAWLGYLTLFLAALLEAVPIVGSVIPGSTIILALSALIPGGELRFEWVLAAAVAGAALGDGTAFWIGHRSQREILSTWPMANYPRVIAQSEAFFHRWGALAVFFARFVPPIRALVPITAGALDMPPLRFYAVNIPAILLWSLEHVLPGVLAVSLLDRYGGIAGLGGAAKHYWMVLVIGGAVVVALTVWAIRRLNGGGMIEPARKHS
jgi:membrane protein DedA with SNARE-associated domain